MMIDDLCYSLTIWAVLSLKPATAVDDSRGNLVPASISHETDLCFSLPWESCLSLFDLRGVNDGRTPPPSDLNVRTKSPSLDLISRLFARVGRLIALNVSVSAPGTMSLKDSLSYHPVSSPVGEASTHRHTVRSGQ